MSASLRTLRQADYDRGDQRRCWCTDEEREHTIVTCTVPGCGSAWYSPPCEDRDGGAR